MSDRSGPLTAVETLFEPRTVAVVGASPTDPVRSQVLRNFVNLKSPTEVMAVNPRYEEVLGFPCYASLRDLPAVPDVVVAAVGRAAAVSVVEEAAGIGVRAAVVFAIGFGEGDSEGRALQSRLIQAAEPSGMAVLGPNCQGLVNFWNPIALYMEAVDPYPPGAVALVGQSGSVTTSLVNNRCGVRWGCIVSSGNEAVLSASDFVRHWVDDPRISVICAFLEVVRNPDAFFAECDRAYAAGKRVIVFKTGRTEDSRRAALAHSGALSAPDRQVQELFRRHHVLRANCAEELLAMALGAQATRPWGSRLATITASGGQIGLVLDEAANVGLKHAELTGATRSLLRSKLPSFVDVRNPVDYWGVEDPATGFREVLRIVAEDPNVDVVVIPESDLNAYPTHYPGSGESSKLDSVAAVAASVEKAFAVVGCVAGDARPELVEQMLERNVLLFSGLPPAFKALSALSAAASARTVAAKRHDFDEDSVRQVLTSFAGAGTGGADVLDLFGSIGLDLAESAVTEDESAAVDAAVRIGYPVVLKAADSAILHKTELGGVFLGLESNDEVRTAFRALRKLGVKSVLVQRQVTGGTELIVGLQTDPALGTFLLVGLGGVWTEVLEDVSIRPVGLREGEVTDMLQELRGSRLLHGERGAAPVDIHSLVEAIERVDAFGVQFGATVMSMDINPLIVTSTGSYAVDGLIMLRS